MTLRALLLVLLMMVAGNAYAGDRFLYGNLFYTAGNSTNGRTSNEVAGYASASIKQLHFITGAWSALEITHRDWDYQQQMGIIGGAFSFAPLGVKGYYLHVDSDCRATEELWLYSDKADLGNAELLYYHWPWYVGVGATRYSAVGMVRQTANTWQGRMERPLGNRIYASLRPGYTWVQDGRRLYSVGLKVNYQPLPRLVLRAGGFAGERAYAFDNDLLTLYNQNETQTGQWSGQADLRLWRELWLSAAYVDSYFRGYSIRYLAAGLKSRWGI